MLYSMQKQSPITVVFYAISMIMSQIALFIVSILVSNSTSQEIYGNFAVAITAIGTIGCVLSLGQDSIILNLSSKYFQKSKPKSIRLLLRSLYLFSRNKYLSFIVLCALLALSYMYASKFLHLDAAMHHDHLLWYFMWSAVAISIYNIFAGFFLSISSIKVFVISYYLQSLIYITGSLLFALYVFPGAPHMMIHAVLLTFACSFIITDILLYYIMKHKGYDFNNSKADIHLKRFAKYSHWRSDVTGYTMINMDACVSTTIPLFALELTGHLWHFDESLVGVLGAIINIIVINNMITTPVTTLLSPYISRCFNLSLQDLKKHCKLYFIICFSIGVAVTAALYIFIKPLLAIFGTKYIPYYKLARIAIIDNVIYNSYIALLLFLEYSQHGSKICKRLTIIDVVVAVVSSVILIAYFGLLGGVIAILFIDSFYLLLVLRETRNMFKHLQRTHT